MAQVQEITARPGPETHSDLRDLTGVPFVTVDNKGTRDIDQAMHISRIAENGGYMTRYAVADACYYVKPGTPLFVEALKRSTSFYLPGLTVPMLPKELSEGVISLNEGQCRRAMVIEMTLDKMGKLTHSSAYRARIRSRRALTYDEVQQYHDGKESALMRQDFTETLDLLREVGELLSQDAFNRGVIQFQRSSVSVHAGEGPGSVFLVRGDHRLPCEKWNEQLSLLCNVVAATILLGNNANTDNLANLQGVWRVHGPPAESSLLVLEAYIKKLVAAHGMDPETSPLTWNKANESLPAYLERITHPCITADIERGAALCKIIHREATMTNAASELDTHPGQHFGLGAPVYTRFSSPMREILGIFIHKEVAELLGMQSPCDNGADERLRKDIIKGATRAKQIQSQITKAINRLAIDYVLESDLHWPPALRPLRSGVVQFVSKDKSRLFVQLDNPPVEVKVYLNALQTEEPAKRLEVDHTAVCVTNQAGDVVRVGDPILVRLVSGSSNADDKWILEPVRLPTSTKNIGKIPTLAPSPPAPAVVLGTPATAK
eukprot:TRINITY_DN306_c0_g1_i2.p1 TRINITY_DN306_c0_g1~~TRINITY_DN306_c0_g1_i2.p1  ORF type:complete len:548 (+),score=60.54 TRINITY_DN306_c0_g1_i2:455-2098(+)